MKSNTKDPQKLNPKITMYPAILLLGISPKRIEIRVSKKYCDEC
jgi:hypothetical protein